MDDRQTSPLSGALFSLNGPATLVGEKDSTRPSLAAACCFSGLPRAVHSCSPGQQEASGAKRGGECLESRESSQKNQGGTVREVQHIRQIYINTICYWIWHVVKCFLTSECDPASQTFAKFIGQKKRRKRQRVKGSCNPFETCCKRSGKYVVPFSKTTLSGHFIRYTCKIFKTIMTSRTFLKDSCHMCTREWAACITCESDVLNRLLLFTPGLHIKYETGNANSFLYLLRSSSYLMFHVHAKDKDDTA